MIKCRRTHLTERITCSQSANLDKSCRWISRDSCVLNGKISSVIYWDTWHTSLTPTDGAQELGAVSSPSRFLCDFIWRAGVRYIINIKKKYARIFVRGHYLFREANSFPRAKLEEKCELRGTDNVQGQISKHIFASNGDYCLYYPSDLSRKARSFENWGIFNNYSPEWRWIVVDVYRAAR